MKNYLYLMFIITFWGFPIFANAQASPKTQAEFNVLNDKFKKEPKYAWELGSALIVSSPAQAQIYFQAAIHNGYKEAMSDIGMLYLTPQHSAEGHKLAKMYFEAAISYGDVFGYIGLGHIYAAGRAVPKDYELANELFQTAILKGEKNGYWAIAHMEEHKVPRANPNTIIDLYVQAAQNGVTSSIWDIARLYKTAEIELKISKKDIVFWFFVHKFNYPKIDVRIDPIFLMNLTQHDISRMKEEAKAYVKSFSF